MVCIITFHFNNIVINFDREHPSSPKHSPHPHSPSSSSSGHSSPRSPPSHPPPPSSHPPPLPHQQRSATATAKQRPSQNTHTSPSHAPRSKSHDMQYGHHGDANKPSSNWKSQATSRAHSWVSPGGTNPDLKKPSSEQDVPISMMIDTNDRGSPSGTSSPGSSHGSQQRHHEPLPPSSLHYSTSSSDHAPSPRQQHQPRFSPEGIQAETGERGGGRSDAKPARSVDHLRSTASKIGASQGMGNVASVSYDSPTRHGMMSASEGGWEGRGGTREGGEGGAKEVVQMNHVALRVAQFNQSNNHHSEETEGGRGGTRGKEKTTQPNTIRSPELEKATVVNLSPGSSEEELTSINSEGAIEVEEADGGYYSRKGVGGGGVASGGVAGGGVASGGVGVPHTQLSQPTYLSKTPPLSHTQPHMTHNPSSYPSLSQPQPTLTYDTTITAHTRGPMDVPFGSHAAPHMVAGVPYEPSKKGHPLPPPQHHQKHPSHGHQSHQHHSYRSHPNQPPSHDYHQRSHDHHMTGHPGSHEHHMAAHPISHDHHMTVHPGSHEHHMTAHPGPHEHHMTAHPGSHDHHMTAAYAAMEQQQHRGHRQQGGQQRREHTLPAITKQNLFRAHEAAANGDLTTLVSV